MTDNQSASQLLHEAWSEGRPIIPFIGAGISVSSGYPLISQLTAYLLKVKFFIQHGIYRHSIGNVHKVTPAIDDPENRTSSYVATFGWPDVNQLESDLYLYCDKADEWFGAADWPESATALKSTLYSTPSKLQWIERLIHPIYSQRFTTTSSAEAEPLLNAYKRVVEASSKWGRGRHRLQTMMQLVASEDIRLSDTPMYEALCERIWRLDLKPRADWFRLLMQLSEGNLGLIDSLFAGLDVRHPTLSHIALAHLVQRLGIRLILTTNFDSLIEQSLAKENARARVFDIGRDESPPDPSVVAQSLSLVKLHGSAFALRFGERLDYALDDVTRACVEKYVSDDALLLVLGFSGYERRMMQLIQSLAARTDSAAARPKVLWMRWESDDRRPAPFLDLKARLNSRHRDTLVDERLSDAGDFLLECYQRITCTLPKSRSGFHALPKRIVDLRARVLDEPVLTIARNVPFHLFRRLSLATPVPVTTVDDRIAGSPSLAMSSFISTLEGYSIIWIDLEDHHTVSGVITEVINRMRIFDPGLPPLMLPYDAETLERQLPRSDDDVAALSNEFIPHLGKPIRFLYRALRRGKYILAFDSLEGFGREHTSHHGLPAQCDFGLWSRLAELL